MNRLIKATLLSLIFLNAAAGQQPEPPPRPLTVEKPFDLGRVEGRRYTNESFRISLSVPEGWVVQDQQQSRAMMEMGKDAILANADQKKKAAAEAGLARTAMLFSASKLPPGSTAGFNAGMALVVERVPTAVVKTGADYVQLMQRVVVGSPVRMEVGAVRVERVGGADFTAADIRLTTPGGVAAQKYYVRVADGYALCLIYSYIDEADLPTLKAILNSVRVGARARTPTRP
ncbi:MAG TPA: hypothetical protein VGX48_23525 [Pyrinomonadaceae bacterium]|jgi:hypothetical protein|nr:hypothetical protein [Pyrinomonadaceae bacterium]